MAVVHNVSNRGVNSLSLKLTHSTGVKEMMLRSRVLNHSEHFYSKRGQGRQPHLQMSVGEMVIEVGYGHAAMRLTMASAAPAVKNARSIKVRSTRWLCTHTSSDAATDLAESSKSTATARRKSFVKADRGMYSEGADKKKMNVSTADVRS
jgi:hypothetical protein